MTVKYFYDVPVFVKHYADESEEDLPVKTEIVDYVLHEFIEAILEQYCDVQPVNYTAARIGKRIRVTAIAEGTYSREIEEAIRASIDGQCSDGWGENGFDLPGRPYGYPYSRITVHVWDYEYGVKTVMSEEIDI